MDVVEEFITRRFKNDCHWLDGNCYYFAMILKIRFPQAVLWYDVVLGHFFVNIDGQDYDWTGKIDNRDDSRCVMWDNMESYDFNVKQYIIRDCIM